MIFQEVRKHPFDYFILILGLLVMAANFFILSHRPDVQAKIILIGAVYYVVWGVFHHWRRRDLCLRILVEYLAIGILALITAFLVLSRV
jgi:hypothetical protein